MPATVVKKANFEEEVLRSEIPVVVDFWAVWCGPCSLQSPELAKFQRAHEGEVKTVKINVDEEQALASEFGVQAIPTLILFKDGKEVKRAVGLQSVEKLEEQFL
ncbi:MAG: thioredoxin [Clostridiales bacterium]|nr:thioredoxin [Clostridiales bacterium]MBS5877639.1 thioredoxin [Clostridiales bacterium]MDU0939474.1 thioredoxin [Clostridiales bacterium]MDU1042006.1 thioredoxin [Clostridiales bacterium]MDU3489947.1 thioredoxin [Clostridiales bacterium]